MTVIVGMTDLLLITAEGEPKRLLQSVKQAADVMLRMLDEAIDFSRLETGTVQITREEFVLGEALRQVSETLAKGAASLQLGVTIDASVPDRLVGDADRLRVIVEGLIRSAAKLRPGRGYELQVLADPDDTGVLLHFLFGNQGTLVEPRQLLAATFASQAGEYLRLADFARRGFFGSGLGLPVAAGLAELMQGEIWMSAKTDAPVVFRFTASFDLPSGQAPADFMATLEEHFDSALKQTAALRILLAEDTETNREFFRAALEHRGHHVVAVTDGQAVLKAFHSSTAGPFDVILLDVEMPVLDGREAAAALRNLQRFSKRPVPIVALTAHQTTGDPEFSAGGLFDAALTKPCDLAHLYALLESLAGGRLPAVAASEPADFPSGDQRVDYRGLLRRLGGNEQLFYDLRRFFLEDVPGVLDKLQGALDQHNSEGVEQAAHSLKGLVANFGAREAMNLASELQTIGRQRELERAPPVFERLAEEVNLLRQELETAYAPA